MRNNVLRTYHFSSLCRQVIKNANGEPLIINIDGTYASVTITGQDDIEVAIVSIMYLSKDDDQCVVSPVI